MTVTLDGLHAPASVANFLNHVNSFRYFTYRQMVRHLMDDQGYSFKRVADRAGEQALVEAETIKAIKDADSQ